MKIALIGPRGIVGRTLINILAENRPDAELDCFSTQKGEELSFGSKILKTEEISTFDPQKYDLIFSATDAETSQNLRPKIEKSKAIWIDKSSAFRQEEGIPLIIPEVNLQEALGKKIISMPNCVVTPLAVFLKSIEKYGIKRLNIATYQSVSGAGMEAMNKLYREIKETLMQATSPAVGNEHQMAFNVIPQIGPLNEEEHCDEEIKIENELRKVLNIEIPISVTCVRVPVVIGHCIALNFELEKSANQETLIRAINKFDTLCFSYKPITPLIAAKEDEIFISRLRKHGNENNWSCWVASDNLRKGAALNAFQTARALKFI